jgi:predicted hotdog family 3-hydroxylacyl-ACP dehydratase
MKLVLTNAKAAAVKVAAVVSADVLMVVVGKVVAVASARVVMVATDSATTKAYILFHNEIPATTGIFFMLKI